jgi:hypothetical protein
MEYGRAHTHKSSPQKMASSCKVCWNSRRVGAKIWVTPEMALLLQRAVFTAASDRAPNGMTSPVLPADVRSPECAVAGTCSAGTTAAARRLGLRFGCAWPCGDWT